MIPGVEHVDVRLGDPVDEAVLLVIRRLQTPAPRCSSGSGCPFPLKGSRHASSISPRMRLATRASGEVVKWEPFPAGSAGRRMRSYLRFAHTGEVAGLLVWTGFCLSLRRFGAWRGRRVRTARS